MATIEGNLLAPVISHNPPDPHWVMDVSWWYGGVRLGGGGGGSVASGQPGVSPPSALSSVRLMIPSISLCCRPDTTLTRTPLSFCICSRFEKGRPARSIMPALITVTPTPIAFTHQDNRIPNQGQRHLGGLNSFSAPCSLNF